MGKTMGKNLIFDVQRLFKGTVLKLLSIQKEQALESPIKSEKSSETEFCWTDFFWHVICINYI